MFQFKDLDIKSTEEENFIGDKIKVDKILNREISVHKFDIRPSKFTETKGDCLFIQIELNNEKRLIMTSAKKLIENIQKVPKDKFPFTTTIIKDNDRYEFT